MHGARSFFSGPCRSRQGRRDRRAVAQTGTLPRTSLPIHSCRSHGQALRPLSHSSIRASPASRRDSPSGCFENATAAPSEIELRMISPRALRARRRRSLRDRNFATLRPRQATWIVFISWYNQRIQRLATAAAMTLPGFPASRSFLANADHRAS